MNTLSGLILNPPDLSILRDLWLVFSTEINIAILNKQSLGKSNIHKIFPISGPNNQFALCADLISEISPGGVHCELFSNLDQNLFGSVDIKTYEDLLKDKWFDGPEDV